MSQGQNQWLPGTTALATLGLGRPGPMRLKELTSHLLLPQVIPRLLLLLRGERDLMGERHPVKRGLGAQSSEVHAHTAAQRISRQSSQESAVCGQSHVHGLE
jgi:hypothetical protein